MASGRARPVRIAGISGSGIDRRNAMALIAVNHPSDPVDIIIGDWLSEGNMTTRGASMASLKAQPDRSNSSSAIVTGNAVVGYEPTFLESLMPALDDIVKHKIRLIVNAGASDPQSLATVVDDLCRQKKHAVKVAWISGDDVFPTIQADLKQGKTDYVNVHTGEKLSDWKLTPIAAQAYLGCFGIARALAEGAQIVICGRVADASLVMGGAAWWHAWKPSQHAELAFALVAGHLIECSSYITGGNFTGFRKFEGQHWHDLGYPIAEIDSEGHPIITKNKGSAGEISVETCTSQLLYEIQGPWYFNSDVTAILDQISFEQLESNRVALHGVKAGPPPPTTKVGLTAMGGVQAEFHWCLVGLDIDAKARMLEAQIRHLLRPYMSKFTCLTFTVNGSSPENPRNQNAATVDFRIFAQAADADDLAPPKFLRPCLDVIMEAYPGATPQLDIRQGIPKPIFEYWVTLVPQTAMKHTAHLLWNQQSIPIPTPTNTKVWARPQPSSPTTTDPVSLSTFGPTTLAPLGYIAHARSGDKGSDANVGFFVRHGEEWDWLRSALSISTIKDLLGEEYNGKKPISRFEIPHCRAVHFLLHDHLDRGVNSTSTYDILGKNVAEYLRARYIEIPRKFLARERI